MYTSGTDDGREDANDMSCWGALEFKINALNEGGKSWPKNERITISDVDILVETYLRYASVLNVHMSIAPCCSR